MNEFEAHESSYDHQHKKRLKEMKEMQRQVVRDSGPTRKEEKGVLMSIKLGGSKEKEAGGAGGFRKGGFKKMNAFVSVAGVEEGADADADGDKGVKREEGERGMVDENENVEVDADSDVTDEEDYYDPRRPTGCHPGCAGVHAG